MEKSQLILKPLYSDSQLTQVLNSIFHISQFRNHQLAVIQSTLSKKDTFCIMRTGGGKSLCYQLPSYIESQLSIPKITLVISPLVSLIQDQVRLLNTIKRGLGECLIGSMKSGEAKGVWERVWSINRSGNVGCLFVTPERVAKGGRLKGELEKLNQAGRLARFIIDECHCASLDGHDFRPDYTKLSILKHHFPQIPILCLTATASSRITMDVCRILRLNQTQVHFYKSGADRENLQYSIKMKKDASSTINEISKFIYETYPNDSGIIYAFSRKEAEDVSDMLRQCGIQAQAYHSSVGDKQKEFIHEGWLRGRWKVVVATIAFGLGIHKGDVR